MSKLIVDQIVPLSGTTVSGSFSGSFYGDGSNLAGVTSYTDADTLTYINTLGVVSGSAQVDLSQATGIAVSASYAVTASHLLGAVDPFPYTGSAQVTGSLTVDGPFVATSITETSARRFKDNITDLETADAVYSLRPVTYNWKNTGDKDLGLIAEEVYEHLPELVEKDQAGEIKGLKYSKITSLLIKAVQEQQHQINHLTQEINSLKNKE